MDDATFDAERAEGQNMMRDELISNTVDIASKGLKRLNDTVIIAVCVQSFRYRQRHDSHALWRTVAGHSGPVR